MYIKMNYENRVFKRLPLFSSLSYESSKMHFLISQYSYIFAYINVARDSFKLHKMLLSSTYKIIDTQIFKYTVICSAVDEQLDILNAKLAIIFCT